MLPLADDTSQRAFWIIVSCLIVVALSIAGFLLGAWARRRIFDTDTTPEAGFGLADLRRLLKEGKITQPEFEKARDKIVAAAKKKADSIPPNNPTKPS